MADKRISQLVDRGTVANNDVVPIVVNGAVTTNKATISSIQTFMQGNLDLGVTSVGITFGTSGTDINASGSPVTSSGNITINLPTASATNRGALSSADWITFNAKQPAGNYVTLDTVQTITAQKTFTGSGSSDTMIISHGSGNGFGLDVIKAGNNEAIRVTKTSGSGNAMTVIGGNFEAPTIVKTGGTSTQYLMADGSTSTLTNPVTGTGVNERVALWNGTNSINSDSDFTYNSTSNLLTLGGGITLTGAQTIQTSTGNLTLATAGGNGNILLTPNGTGKVGIGTITPEGSGLTVASGGILVSLDPGVDRKVLELYSTSTGAKVSSSYVGASSYGSLELLTSNVARLTIADTGAVTLTGALNGTSASFSGNVGVGTNTYTVSSGFTGVGINNATNGGLLDLLLNDVKKGELYITSTSFNMYGFAGVGLNLTVDNNASKGLFLASTGAATFSSSVTASGAIKLLTAANGTNAINFGTSAVNYHTITYDDSTGKLTFNTDSSRIVSFLNSNVGIGTASPDSVTNFTNLSINGTSGAFISMRINETLAYRVGTNSGEGYLLTTGAIPLIFYTDTTERMRITSVGNTQPGADNAYSLGVSGTRWSAVWAANGTIQTSDEREKKDIVDSDLGLDLITKLRPVSFKWKVGQNVVTSQVVKDEEGNPILDEEGNEKTESVLIPREGKRTHYGLIAQEVEEVLDGKDFGGFIHDEETDTKGLRYDQFVPLLIKSIQELNNKIAILESKLK
jgi:hypothetical protein